MPTKRPSRARPYGGQTPAKLAPPAIGVGSVVQLNSGGLEMTVLAVDGDDVEVIWSTYGLDERILPRAILKLSTRREPDDSEIPF